MEELWKKDAPKERKIHLVGLIQLAVALYHQRRGNIAGAEKMSRNALRIFQTNKEQLHTTGLDADTLISLTVILIEEIKQQIPYKSINLPITNEVLLKECLTQCEGAGLHWGTVSDLQNKNIIDKHLLRDRQDVIGERQRQLVKKQKDRGN